MIVPLPGLLPVFMSVALPGRFIFLLLVCLSIGVNQIIVDGYASLFNCTTAVRASTSMTASS